MLHLHYYNLLVHVSLIHNQFHPTNVLKMKPPQKFHLYVHAQYTMSDHHQTRETNKEGSSCQKFPAAFATVEIDVEQIACIELHLDPRTAVGNDAEAVEDFSIRVNGGLEANAW